MSELSVVHERPLTMPTQATVDIKEKSQSYVLFALMLAMMLCGWAEGSIGPLMPSLQAYYAISYTKVSLVFVASFVGGLVAGLANVFITDKIGFAYAAPLGALIQAAGYGLGALGLPFPVFLVHGATIGFGITLQDAQVNNIASRLRAAASSVSIVQGCFSVGATIGPFFSTAFAEKYHLQAYRFFWFPSAVAVLTAVGMLHACAGVTEASLKSQAGGAQGGQAAAAPLDDERQALLPAAPAEAATSSAGKMGKILTMPSALAVIAWSFSYSGIEMVVSTFMTSYLLSERGASISAGNVTTGFWAAMTFSRFTFTPISTRLGYTRAVVVYSLIALLATAAIPIFPTLKAATVCFLVIGLMFGPLYPNALMSVSKRLDDDLRAGIIGMMGCMGGAGSAFFSLLSGNAFDRFGFGALVPIIAVLTAFQAFVFGLFVLLTRRR